MRFISFIPLLLAACGAAAPVALPSEEEAKFVPRLEDPKNQARAVVPQIEDTRKIEDKRELDTPQIEDTRKIEDKRDFDTPQIEDTRKIEDKRDFDTPQIEDTRKIED